MVFQDNKPIIWLELAAKGFRGAAPWAGKVLEVITFGQEHKSWTFLEEVKFKLDIHSGSRVLAKSKRWRSLASQVFKTLVPHYYSLSLTAIPAKLKHVDNLLLQIFEIYSGLRSVEHFFDPAVWQGVEQKLIEQLKKYFSPDQAQSAFQIFSTPVNFDFTEREQLALGQLCLSSKEIKPSQIRDHVLNYTWILPQSDSLIEIEKFVTNKINDARSLGKEKIRFYLNELKDEKFKLRQDQKELFKKVKSFDIGNWFRFIQRMKLEKVANMSTSQSLIFWTKQIILSNRPDMLEWDWYRPDELIENFLSGSVLENEEIAARKKTFLLRLSDTVEEFYAGDLARTKGEELKLASFV